MWNAMSFGRAIEHVLTNYANFNGRARRSEFWYFMLFYWLVVLCFAPLTAVPGLALLEMAFMLGMTIPSVAVCWRRLHDIGRSGAWWLLILLPLVGTVMLVIWLTQDSQPWPNQYGPSPKQVSARPGPGGQAGGGLVVRCLNGPMQGQTYQVGSQGLQFGRDNACAVRFPDGTPGVSRRHCRLYWSQGGPALVDLGSSYGTFLTHGKQLPPNCPEPVAAGTRFYLGNTGNLFQITTY